MSSSSTGAPARDYQHRDGYMLISPARFLKFRFQRHIKSGALKAAIRWHDHPLELLSLEPLTDTLYNARCAVEVEGGGTAIMLTRLRADAWIALVQAESNFTIDVMGRTRPALNQRV